MLSDKYAAGDAEEDLNNLPNGKQIDGSHYKKLHMQPWDFIIANNIPYLEGNIIKYICRHRKKGGAKDLLKAMHYLEKLLESY